MRVRSFYVPSRSRIQHARSRAGPSRWSSPFEWLNNSHKTETEMQCGTGNIPGAVRPILGGYDDYFYRKII